MLALLRSYRLAFIMKDLAPLPYLFHLKSTEILSLQRVIFSEDTAFPGARVCLPVSVCLKGSWYLHLPPKYPITFKVGRGSAISFSSHFVRDSTASYLTHL